MRARRSMHPSRYPPRPTAGAAPPRTPRPTVAARPARPHWAAPPRPAAASPSAEASDGHRGGDGASGADPLSPPLSVTVRAGTDDDDLRAAAALRAAVFGEEGQVREER